MKKKMAILMTVLVGTMAFALVGCKTKIGWIDKKICDHDECKLVEVVEEATCEKEGERLMECVDCGKTITEKVEKLPHTDDGEGTCEVCEETIYELVAAEEGEFVAGNTYRLFYAETAYDTLYLSNDTGTYFYSGTDRRETSYLWWSGSSGPVYYLEGLEVVKTDTYFEFNLQPGTYKILKFDGTDTGDTYVIDEETTISSATESVCRVVAGDKE